MINWFAQIETWPAAEALRTSFYVYPLVNAAHIFGIAMLVGTILPVDLRLLGLLRRVPIAGFIPVMTGFSVAGLAVAAVSGVLLFMVQAQDYVSNPAFVTKLALVGLGVVNALALRATGAWRALLSTGEIRPAVRASALLSLVIWPTALLSGRWIGYL